MPACPIEGYPPSQFIIPDLSDSPDLSSPLAACRLAMSHPPVEKRREQLFSTRTPAHPDQSALYQIIFSWASYDNPPYMKSAWKVFSEKLFRAGAKKCMKSFSERLFRARANPCSCCQPVHLHLSPSPLFTILLLFLLSYTQCSHCAASKQWNGTKQDFWGTLHHPCLGILSYSCPFSSEIVVPCIALWCFSGPSHFNLMQFYSTPPLGSGSIK